MSCEALDRQEGSQLRGLQLMSEGRDGTLLCSFAVLRGFALVVPLGLFYNDDVVRTLGYYTGKSQTCDLAMGRQHTQVYPCVGPSEWWRHEWDMMKHASCLPRDLAEGLQSHSL